LHTVFTYIEMYDSNMSLPFFDGHFDTLFVKFG